MGWGSSSQTLLIISALTSGFSGIFVYSPGPGAGNLIASVTANAGTDPYGNAYQKGITSYAGAGAVWVQLLGASLTYSDSSTIVSTGGHIQLAPGANLNSFLTLIGTVIWAAVPVVASNPVTGTAPETFHSLTPGNSWTGTFNYQLTAGNNVQLSFSLTAPGAGVNGVTIVTLPTQYRPTTNKTFPVGSSGQNAAAGARMTVSTTGTCQVADVTANASPVAAEVQFPLGI